MFDILLCEDEIVTVNQKLENRSLVTITDCFISLRIELYSLEFCIHKEVSA